MYVQVKDMYICIKKGKSTWFLALKIWALVSLKFFDVVLKFELPNTRVLNFPKISALSLIVVVLINGDCVYFLFYSKPIWIPTETPTEPRTKSLKRWPKPPPPLSLLLLLQVNCFKKCLHFSHTYLCKIKLILWIMYRAVVSFSKPGVLSVMWWA